MRMCVVERLRISFTSRIGGYSSTNTLSAGKGDKIVLLPCVAAESGLRALAVFARARHTQGPTFPRFSLDYLFFCVKCEMIRRSIITLTRSV